MSLPLERDVRMRACQICGRAPFGQDGAGSRLLKLGEGLDGRHKDSFVHVARVV